MAKILIARNLYDLLKQGSSFLNRADMQVFAVDSNDDLLRIQRTERADLIVTQIDMPGTDTEKTFAAMHGDKANHSTPVIMVCTNRPGEIDRCARCGVSDVLLRPVNQRVLLTRVQQFLALFTRESSRVAVSMEVQVRSRDQSFTCRCLDIGASGMMLESDRVLSKGERISCSCALPGSRGIRAEAEIVNAPVPPRETRIRRYGVHFTDISEDSREAVQAFVNLKSRAAA